jgi:O-antigen/teichoic acid export membrane protein
VTGVLARPFTTLVLGQRYEPAAVVLMILASGFFVDAVMGFNVHTLRVFARVRQIVMIDVVTIVLAIGLCFLLIPTHGAWGAAVAIAAATIMQNMLFQWAMLWTTGVGKAHWANVQFFTCCAALVGGLALVQWCWSPPLWLGVAIAVAGYCALLWANRSLIDVHGTFPELLRIPLVGRFFAAFSKPRLTKISEAKT